MWENVVAGRSGIRQITLFDTDGLGVQIAGEVPGFDPTNYMSAKQARRADRFTQFAIAALEEALGQSGLVVNEHNAHDVGSIVGSGIGGVGTYTQELDVLREHGARRVSPLLVPMISVDVPSVHVALRTGARGPNMGISSACATSANAIGQACETIRRGHAQAMFTGGFEAAVSPIALATFDRMRALSRRNHDPAAASRPFDADRDGFVMAEGGALFVLEDLEYALARGAEPLAEIAGYASTSDAIHVTAPDPEGIGVALCMTLSIQRAGVSPVDVDYINTHGTSTPLGDPAETQAIKRVLGDRAYRVPASATKSMHGHLIGGAGALEAAISIQAIRAGIVPPTINLDTPDPVCDLDYVPFVARKMDLGVVLSNSIGFGGHNACLVIRRAPDSL
jgi:beta-ketoacyl-acyl-carrier-protein synthase II